MSEADAHSSSPTFSSGGKTFIGGWLLLPLVQLIASSLVSMFTILDLVLHGDFFPPLQSFFSHAFITSFVVGSRLLTVARVAFGVFCLVQFLNKAHRAPKLMMIWYMLIIAELSVAAWLSGRVLHLVQFGAMSIAMIVYFSVSKRVRATFVR